MRSLGHDNKEDLVEELLTLMARDQQTPEVWNHMASCQMWALETTSVCLTSLFRSKKALQSALWI